MNPEMKQKYKRLLSTSYVTYNQETTLQQNNIVHTHTLTHSQMNMKQFKMECTTYIN